MKSLIATVELEIAIIMMQGSYSAPSPFREGGKSNDKSLHPYVPPTVDSGASSRSALSVSNFKALRQAADTLKNVSAKDHNPDTSDLSKLLTAGSAGRETKHQYFVQSNTNSRVFSHDCKSIPRAIREEMQRVDCNLSMGIFTEINRAWIAVDNRLFLWNYYKSEDFYVYDGLDQLITCVGLARPRVGVFDPEVEFLLVVSTPVEIILLQLRFVGHPAFGDIELYPTHFRIHSDGISMRRIVSTTRGRIFMAGHNGTLYELMYESAGMLHSLGMRRQCRKVEVSGWMPGVQWIVPSFLASISTMGYGPPDPLVDLAIDQERGLLYSLSSKSILSLYRLGGGASNTQNAAAKGAGNFSAPAFVVSLDAYQVACKFLSDPRNQDRARNLQPNSLTKPTNFVSINVVKRSESSHIHLVCISDRGVRFYFSTRGGGGFMGTNYSMGARQGRGQDGKNLTLVHVRGPPESTKLADQRIRSGNGLDNRGRGVGLGSRQSRGVSNTSRNDSGYGASRAVTGNAGSGTNSDSVPPGPCTDSCVSVWYLLLSS